MATDTSERKATKSSPVGAPPPEPEHLPCPRCDSTNTKFCYYNNYNFSQPRHFCKACRRYWTHGGTLRDIPIGGGSRKNAKRSRTTIAAAAPAATTTSSGSTTGAVFSSAHHHDFRHLPAGASQLLVADHGGTPVPFITDGKMSGSFTSLLNINTHYQGTGLVALGGFGLGFEDMGFGLGRGVWPFTTSGQGGGSSVAGHTWQVENIGENGFGTGSGDCFALPDLAISTPGSTVLK